MSFATWIAFVIAGTVIAISPGSGAVLSMSHGLAYGVKKASATVLGLQFGLILVLVIAGAGVGTLLLASPTAFPGRENHRRAVPDLPGRVAVALKSRGWPDRQQRGPGRPSRPSASAC
jgi:hypothetical protein